MVGIPEIVVPGNGSDFAMAELVMLEYCAVDATEVLTATLRNLDLHLEEMSDNHFPDARYARRAVDTENMPAS